MPELLAQARAQRDRAATLRLPLELAFRWDAIEVQAALAEPVFGRLTLHLSLRLGHLPFSIEDAAARRAVLRLIRRRNIEGPDRWHLDPDGRIRLESGTVLEAPQSRADLVGALAVALLLLEPRIEPVTRRLRR